MTSDATFSPPQAHCDRFEREADMIPFIQEYATRLWPRSDDVWLLLPEHNVYSHVPDLVAARLDVEALEARFAGDWTRALNQREIVAMRVLRPDRGSRLEAVASRMRVRSEIADAVLRRLFSDGYVDRTSEGSYARLAPIRPILSRIVSFEAKRLDARGALLQARAHTMFVDAAYVVCDAAYRARFERFAQSYRAERVGLIALDSAGASRLIIRAQRPPLRDSVLRMLGTERALARLLDPVEQETPERRLPTASAGAGLRGAPTFVGSGAIGVQALLATVSCTPS